MCQYWVLVLHILAYHSSVKLYVVSREDGHWVSVPRRPILYVFADISVSYDDDVLSTRYQGISLLWLLVEHHVKLYVVPREGVYRVLRSHRPPAIAMKGPAGCSSLLSFGSVG